jgi:hypothetical protein
MKTAKIAFPVGLLFIPLIMASKCVVDEKEVDPKSASSLCDHFVDLCGDDIYEGDISLCKKEVSAADTCRKKCLSEQDSCDAADQCISWQLGYGGAADAYCTQENDYSDMEECAEGECSSSYDACGLNSDCTGIFNDCLVGCEDWTCVELCAELGYSNGIDDFNNLWTCLNSNCGEFL